MSVGSQQAKSILGERPPAAELSSLGVNGISAAMLRKSLPVERREEEAVEMLCVLSEAETVSRAWQTQLKVG